MTRHTAVEKPFPAFAGMTQRQRLWMTRHTAVEKPFPAFAGMTQRQRLDDPPYGG
jgi:hypothetical protein